MSGAWRAVAATAGACLLVTLVGWAALIGPSHVFTGPGPIAEQRDHHDERGAGRRSSRSLTRDDVEQQEHGTAAIDHRQRHRLARSSCSRWPPWCWPSCWSSDGHGGRGTCGAASRRPGRRTSRRSRQATPIASARPWPPTPRSSSRCCSTGVAPQRDRGVLAPVRGAGRRGGGRCATPGRRRRSSRCACSTSRRSTLAPVSRLTRALSRGPVLRARPRRGRPGRRRGGPAGDPGAGRRTSDRGQRMIGRALRSWAGRVGGLLLLVLGGQLVLTVLDFGPQLRGWALFVVRVPGTPVAGPRRRRRHAPRRGTSRWRRTPDPTRPTTASTTAC